LATPLREADSNWVYIIANTEVSEGSFLGIDFASSTDYGQTWAAPQSIATGNRSLYPISGGKIAGGLGGEVLVAFLKQWYAADCTGEAIQVRRSGNHGATFGPTVNAATHAHPECVYSSSDIKIGHQGAAHLVYGRNGDGAGGVGDIQYIWSPGVPYTTWSQPVIVNDDGLSRTHGSPSLAMQKCGTSTILHVVWQDARLSPTVVPDRHWDVFYARKIAKPGAGWSKNVRVSGKSSLAPAWMVPDMAVSQGRVFVAWTDRRDKTDLRDYETDVYGSGTLSGITCP
jgi:hypothetical protein